MKLATIETIKDIRVHNNADKLELATVLGWTSVVKKGEFKVGDKIVFVVIDTILPDVDWSAFLKRKDDKPIRLNTVKLRGEYSQGLVLPISVLPSEYGNYPVGFDVGEILQIKKYEKEIPASLAGDVKCNFPSYLVAPTDEDNGLSNLDLVNQVLAGPVNVTQKLDGSSMTVVIDKGNIEHVCSRKFSLKESDNAYWIATRKITIPKNWTGIIQGELMGPKVQGNQLGLKSYEIFVYQIKVTDKWMEQKDMEVFSTNYLNCKVCPFVATFEKISLKELEELSDAQFLPSGQAAEGIVIRPVKMEFFERGRPLGFKVINKNYKD